MKNRLFKSLRAPEGRGNLVFVLSVLFLAFAVPAQAELNTDKLSDTDIAHVKTLLQNLDPLIKSGTEAGTLASLTFDELYAPLDKEDTVFLKSFHDLDAKTLGVHIPFRGIAAGDPGLFRIENQVVKMEGKETTIPPQYLPKDIYDQYLVMMEAMEKELRKRLYVESGYRSSAYQLYLFVFYLQNHDYSIKETVKWVALPGYSEHGSPEHQAIDFINGNGISGETNPAEFENLVEYKWLLGNAGKFGFTLSYPKNTPGITFEPWHWRFDTPSGIMMETKESDAK